MNAIIGIVVVLGSVLGGFMMHGGNPLVLLQWSEYLIILGAAIGAIIIAQGIGGVLHLFKETLGLLKGNPYNKERYSELLALLYEFFQVARREGEIKLEPHVENPAESDIFKKYPAFLENQHAVSFLSDTVKVILSGTIDPHDLDAALDMDLERYEEEATHTAHTLATTGDAMPGYGIVACVLGVVVTMGKIGGDAADIGHSVGAALVGTFIGILFAYGVFAPLSQATGVIAKSEMAYLSCIKAALLSYVKGDSPLTCVEFARRSIEPAFRPTFVELETMTRKSREG
jgi:chemotaxis protein MotA